MFSHSCLSVVAMEKQIVVFVFLHNFCLSEGMPALYIIFDIFPPQ